jgi:4-hydroxybenzoate polyprenyltransferase
MTDASHHLAEKASASWVERLMPSGLRPYAQLMRLDRPIGWWLLLLPCWWGMLLAQVQRGEFVPDFRTAFLFLVGAILMRGAGCVGNDIVDRDIDRKVARTRMRPLASGRVSVTAACGLLVALSLAGLAVLLQFNAFTIVLGISSLAIVAIYPFMKRITHWPQAVLGFAFNWGALVGWSAIAGRLDWPAVLLYAGGIFWTLGYDTIYAQQDMEDDALIGVKSTALKFGADARAWLIAFYTLALLLISAAVRMAHAGYFSWAGVALAGLHAIWQLRRFEVGSPGLAPDLFKSNRVFGLVLAGGFLMDVIL